MRVIHVARKPLSGTVASTALRYGTGGLNVDAGRIGFASEADAKTHADEWDREYNPDTNSSPIHTWDNAISNHPGQKRSHGGGTKITSGRWPANLILQHEPGCRLTGTKTVQGYTINRWVDGAKPFGGGAGHEYESIIPLVTEDVEMWECVPGCPVKNLDAQSGNTRAAVRQPTGNPVYPTTGVAMTWNENSVVDNTVRGFLDEGGASRYFKQVQADPEFFRASGDCLCPTCEEPYRKHSYDMKVLDSEGHPWLHVLCDGTRVKL